MSGGRVVYLDPAACTVTVNPSTIPNDGETPATISVLVLNTDGEPMAGLVAARLSVTSTGSSNTITAIDAATNRLGVITYSLTSTSAASKTISATVLSTAITDTAALTVTGDSPAAFFEDDFSSGDLDKTENGFSWGGGNTGFVEVIDTATVGLPINPSASGKAVEFDYNVDNNAELDFKLVANDAAPGLSTLYLRYYAYYPDGTEGGTVGPEWSRTGTANNKLLRLYNTVEHADRTLGFGTSTYGSSSGGTGYSAGDERTFLESGQPGSYNTAGQFGSVVPFIVDARRGQWLKIEYQMVMPTEPNTVWNEGNGVMRFWVDDTLILESTTATQSDGTGVMRGGYLMGFPNSPYVNAGTKMYITDFAVSTTGRV